MPNIQSAKKALRQSTRRHTRNLTRRSELKSVISQFKKHLASNQAEEAKKMLPLVYKKLDKSVKNKLFAKNKSARIKSRLTKLLEKTAK